MADELDPALEGGAEEHIDTPETDTPDDPIAKLATEMGWQPDKDKLSDPSKWKPADEFIRAGRDIQQSSARELRAMREQMERLSGVTESIVQDKVAQARAQWEAKLDRAVDDGDHEAAREATKQLAKADAPRQSGPDPTAAAWVAKNEWFNADPLARREAMMVAEGLAKDGYPAAEQLAQAERAVKKKFPELFPPAVKDPPGTQTANTRNANPTNRIKGYAHMPDDAQKMALDYEERHGVKREDFAKRYWSNREPKK